MILLVWPNICSIAYLDDVVPSVLVEVIEPEVFLVDFLRFWHHVVGDDRSHQPSLDDVLEAKEDGRRELAATTLEVRVDVGRVRGILFVMSYLK